MLADRPDICAHIRRFAVRPNYYLSWPKPDEPLDEDWVVARIEAIAPSLTSMHTFDWDGLEMPLDRLWGTLQSSYVIFLFRVLHLFRRFARCPNLRNVSSNVGIGPLDLKMNISCRTQLPVSSSFLFFRLSSPNSLPSGSFSRLRAVPDSRSPPPYPCCSRLPFSATVPEPVQSIFPVVEAR
jgi:hypothetical protein